MEKLPVGRVTLAGGAVSGEGVGEGVGLGVEDGGPAGTPTITTLSTRRAAEAEEPTATATILQHTVGFPSALTGMLGERRPVIQVAAGARDTVEPKAVNAPAEPATPY